MDLDTDVPMEDVEDQTYNSNDPSSSSSPIKSANKSTIKEAATSDDAKGEAPSLDALSINQLDAWIEKLSKCEPLSEADVKKLCNMAIDV